MRQKVGVGDVVIWVFFAALGTDIMCGGTEFYGFTIQFGNYNTMVGGVMVAISVFCLIEKFLCRGKK